MNLLFLLHFYLLYFFYCTFGRREKSLERKLLKIYDKTEPDHERDERLQKKLKEEEQKEGATTKMMKNMVCQKQVYPPFTLFVLYHVVLLINQSN